MFYSDEKRKITGISCREQTVTTNRLIRIHGESLPEVQEWLAKNPGKWAREESVNNAKSNKWDFSVGFEGAERLAREGWAEGAADLDSRLQAIIPAASNEARWGYHKSGSRVSVPRYLKEHPNQMVSKRRKDFGAAPVLHLVINTVCSWFITAEQMKNYGVAMVGLVDRLEGAGRRCIVDVTSVTHGRNARLAVGWRIKEAQDAVDLSAVAFSLAHPAAFRRLGFAMMERSPRECETTGYGQPMDIADFDVTDPTPGTMLIDGINAEHGRCNSPVDALRLAIEQLNKAAVIAGHATIDDPLIDASEDLFAY